MLVVMLIHNETSMMKIASKFLLTQYFYLYKRDGYSEPLHSDSDGIIIFVDNHDVAFYVY